MFYGWKLAGLGLIGNLMIQGGAIYIMNAFMEPLEAMHGWSRTSITLAISAASIFGTLAMPISITLSQKFQIRIITALAALIGGIAFIGKGWVSSVFLFGICFSIVWMSGQACGGALSNVLIQRWFVKYRGRAFGIVNVGTSLAGAVLPFISLLLVDALGVTSAYTLLGCVVLLLCPISYIMIRDKPEDMGLTVDGVPEEPKATPPAGVPALSKDLTVKQILSYKETWTIGISFGIALMTAAGVVSQLKPRFVEVGMGDYEAMTFMCLTAAFGAVGKYGWGWGCDKISSLTATRLLFISNAISLTFILLPNNFFTTILFVCTWGISMGGILTVLPAMVTHAFGREKFPSVYKIMALFTLLKALGYSLMGISFDLFDSYDFAYIAMIAALGVSILGMCIITEKELDRLRNN